MKLKGLILMIEPKELPSEFVSLRQLWMKRIDDCGRAMSQVANLDTASEMKEEYAAAPRTIVYSVGALYFSLVDVGEATILSDVTAWKEKHHDPKINKLWGSKTLKEGDETATFAGLREDKIIDPPKEQKILTNSEKWWAHSRESQFLYHQILIILNVYGMLFQEQPKGYSNVIMESV